MPNTCKSNETFSILIVLLKKKRLQWRTGEERVRTYLLVGDNSGKLLLKPHNAEELKVKTAKREACV